MMSLRSERVSVRQAHPDEIDQIAAIWYQGWQDAHGAILPVELARLRTHESFTERLRVALDTVRVVGEPGNPLGFCMTKDAELYQLYVAAEARGTGVARALESDALELIATRGARVAWLACAIGNDRAARFYAKCGWQLVGTVVLQLETQVGIFPLEVWRYEKACA